MRVEEVISTTHRLERSGMTRKEAEAVIGVLQDVVVPLATKDDLAAVEKSIREDMKSMATKDDLALVEKSIRDDMKSMATKADLEHMATKAELASMESRLLWRLPTVILGVGGFFLAVLRFFM